MRQLFEHPQGQEIESDIDITADLSKEYTVRSKLRNFTGMHAIDMMRQDPLFLEALNELYLLPWEANEVSLEKGNDFQLRMQNRLKRLGERHGFDPNKDLPQFVTDAVMFSTPMALDAQHLSSADRRYRVYFLAENYNNAVISLAPKQAKFWKPIIELLGFHFRFTESPLMKMGYIDSLNLAFNYHAFVPDDREFNPAKYPDQLDKVWQYMYMFCLELRENQLTRREVDEDNKKYAAKSYTSLAGQVDAYTDYDNNRWIQREGGKKIFDHRRGAYNRFKKMSDEDQALLTRGEGGKTGWDKQLRTNLNAVLAFLSKPQKLDILGVQIQTNGEEIFYNDQLAELLNEYENNRTDAKFTPYINYLEGFLTMRNVLRDARAWGLVWGLGEGRGKENEALDRLEAKKDLELAHIYDVVGDEDRSKLLKIINVAPFVTPGEMPVTPATVLETIKEFGHRYKTTQFYPTMFKLYEFANLSLVMRMSQLEIPDIRSLAQAVDPTGEIRFGVWGEHFIKALGPEWRQAFLLQKTLWENAQNLGYIEKLTLLDVTLAEQGFFEMYDNALEIEVLRLVIAEALQWQHQRDIPLKQRGGVQRYIAGYRDPYQPVKSWQVPDVTVEWRKGKVPIIEIHQLLVEDLTPHEIKTYFRIIKDEREAGACFGGVREATLGVSSLEIKVEPLNEAKQVLDAKKTPQFIRQGETLGVFTEIYDKDSGNWWYQVGVTKDEKNNWHPLGWVRCRPQDMGMVTQAIDGEVRQGEIMLQGGRYYYDGNSKEWCFQKGTWDLPKGKKDISGKIIKGPFPKSNEKEEGDVLENYNVFFPGYREGVDRLRHYRIRKGFGEKEEQTGLDDIGGWDTVKDGVFTIEPQKGKEVIEPLVVFKDLESRVKFFLWRKHISFQTLFGYSREKEGLQRGQAMVDLGAGFKMKSAQFTDIFRWAGFVLGQMRKVKRIAGYKQILIQRAKEEFGLEIMTPQEKTAGGIIEQRMVPTQLGIQQELFPEDIELVEKYRSELGFWGILTGRKGDFWKEKGRLMTALGGAGRTILNKTLIGIYRTLNLNLEKIPFVDLKLPFKINVPVNLGFFLVIANVLKVSPWKFGALFAALKIAPWQFLVGYGIPWAILNGLVPYLGTQLTSKIYVKAREEVNKIPDYERDIEPGLSKFTPAI